MIHFFHTFLPSPIIVDFGFITLRWYGLLVVLGIIAALYVALFLGKKYFDIDKEVIFDLAFWLIITGLIGARIYDVFLQLPFYIENPIQILQIWKGGVAIHGGIIAGLITIYFFGKNKKINFFKLTALIVPGLALGQAIGRFGNYFNQELYGLPTNLPWGIPINFINRPLEFINQTHFHPTFLYESIGSFIIFIILIYIYIFTFKRKRDSNHFFVWSTALYMILYSVLRFSLEYLRLDQTPEFLGMRWPQVISLFIIFISILTISIHSHVNKKSQ